MPSSKMKFNELRAREPKNPHFIRSRRRIEMPTTWLHKLNSPFWFLWTENRWLGYTQIPKMASNGSKALGDTGVMSNRRELKRTVFEMHNIKPVEISKNQLGYSHRFRTIIKIDVFETNIYLGIPWLRSNWASWGPNSSPSADGSMTWPNSWKLSGVASIGFRFIVAGVDFDSPDTSISLQRKQIRKNGNSSFYHLLFSTGCGGQLYRGYTIHICMTNYSV